MRPDLEPLYLATSYRVFLADGPVDVRIGARHPSIDRDAQGRTWAIVTACNPRSMLATAEENERAMARLDAELDQEGIEWWPALGIPDRPGWAPEKSRLVFVDRVRALRLCSAHRQNAVVFAEPGGPAELVWSPPEAD